MLLTSRKGIVLMAAYWMISLMSVLSLAAYSRGSSYLISAERNSNRIVAFNMAEAAVDFAIAQLKTDPSYTGSGGYVGMSTSNVEGGFSVTVTTPAGNPNVRLLNVVGYSPDASSTSRAAEQRSITAYAEIEEDSVFDFAVFSKEDIQINGNSIIDSYNSNDGAYDPNNANSNGDIGTNTTQASQVDLNGNVTVNGSAQVGPGGNPNSVINLNGHATITGTQSAMDKEKTLDTPSVPAGAVNLGNIQLNGNTVYYLPGGTYEVGKFKINGNAKIIATGDVKLYVSDSVSINGNGISTSNNKPPSMLIYVTGNEDVHLNGNTDFYGGIYAPNSSFHTNGNAELYGAVVAKDFQQNGNADIHYDEALSEVGGGGDGGVGLKSWVENNTYAGS